MTIRGVGSGRSIHGGGGGGGRGDGGGGGGGDGNGRHERRELRLNQLEPLGEGGALANLARVEESGWADVTCA